MKKIISLFFVFAYVSLWSFSLSAETIKATSSERIVSADAGVTAMLYALGVEKKLVGIDVTSVQPAGNTLPVVGYHRQLATEGILALHPSLLIGSEHMGPPATLAALESVGVTVVRLPLIENGDDLLVSIRQLANVLAQPIQTPAVLLQVEKKLVLLKQQALPSNSRALFLLSGSRGLRAAGTGTGGDALIRLLGANNAMTYNSYQPISAEAIMAVNPDVVLLTSDSDLDASKNFLHDYPVLAELKAAQAKKVLNVHSETLVAGLSLLTLDEALRLQSMMQQQAVQPELNRL